MELSKIANYKMTMTYKKERFLDSRGLAQITDTEGEEVLSNADFDESAYSYMIQDHESFAYSKSFLSA